MPAKVTTINAELEGPGDFHRQRESGGSRRDWQSVANALVGVLEANHVKLREAGAGSWSATPGRFAEYASLPAPEGGWDHANANSYRAQVQKGLFGVRVRATRNTPVLGAKNVPIPNAEGTECYVFLSLGGAGEAGTPNDPLPQGVTVPYRVLPTTRIYWHLTPVSLIESRQSQRKANKLAKGTPQQPTQ